MSEALAYVVAENLVNRVVGRVPGRAWRIAISIRARVVPGLAETLRRVRL